MTRGEGFSFRSRKSSIDQFKREVFDLLIVGGGITGAAVARDAASRGLKVALVERRDFAYGTSSRSSKLIHGGLRYLENLELGLVFEALAERALLLKTAPHMVRPLPFYFPVYTGDTHGKFKLSLGLWLYDLLALFRTPEFHRNLSRKKILEQIPFLRAENLKGGFRYYDASMWDDVLTVETLRAACEGGAAVANYVEAVQPLWSQDKSKITGFVVRDLENLEEITVRAQKTVICAGPWTDQLGGKLSGDWARWLKPSKGVHLVFDLSRIPLPGAMVMNHPEDGRVVFVIPRPDFGAGVVIVGTTDGPTPDDPDQARVTLQDVEYLMSLLSRYFPTLRLTKDDILSAYVGVRPLMDQVKEQGSGSTTASGPGRDDASILQKVSREHFIGNGPGGTVVVAGGKYTTHRRMAEEIVDFTLASSDFADRKFGKSKTEAPVNPRTTPSAIAESMEFIADKDLNVPSELVARYGAEAVDIVKLAGTPEGPDDPNGFPFLAAQLRYAVQNEMVIHLEDFYMRRVPLFASRKDHGLPWAAQLARVLAEELGLSDPAQVKSRVDAELKHLQDEVNLRSGWQTG